MTRRLGPRAAFLRDVAALFVVALALDRALAGLPLAAAPSIETARLGGLWVTFPIVLPAAWWLCRHAPRSTTDAPPLSTAVGEVALAALLLILATAFANLARFPDRARGAASLYLAALGSVGAIAFASARRIGLSTRGMEPSDGRRVPVADALGLPASKAAREAALGLLAAAGFVPLLALAVRFFPSAFPERIGSPQGLAGRPELGALVFLTGAVVLPFAEEYLFRWRLQPAIARYVGTLPAVVLQALLFAALHLDGFAPPFAGGLLFGALAARTGALWAPWAAHVFFNAGLFLAPTLLPRLPLYAGGG